MLTDAYTHIPVFPKSVEQTSNEDREEARRIMREAGRAVAQVHANQDILFLFPEGTRTRSGQLGQGIPEAASYMRGTNRYIVPLGIIGTYELYPPGRIFPRKGEVSIRLGEPIDSSTIPYTGPDRKQAMVDYVMDSVAQLLPEEQRGYYAEEK